MLRRFIIASALSLAAAGTGWSQDLGPRLIGGSENAKVVYSEPSQNVVGGGAATIIGGSNDQRLAYGSATRTQPQAGLVAEIIGGGENQEVVYRQTGPASSMVAGRSTR